VTPNRSRLTSILLFLAGASCGDRAPARVAEPPAAAPSIATAPAQGAAAPDPAPKSAAGKATAPAPLERPKKPLTIAEARRYMLDLINRDRATQGLPPVALDDGPGQAAAQQHAEDMAKLGYLGHWGSDGSVPEQRHTEAGGSDMVLENALCFTDEKKRTLDPKPAIDPAQLEKSESQFFDEQPPNDGHRKNILKATHTRVGIGIAQPISTATEIGVPCVSQEFIDGYGTYAPIPKKAKVGSTVHVEGTLTNAARPVGVGLARVALPRPLPASELNKRRTYQMYWGPGFVTPIRVNIDGQRFAIDVPLSDAGQQGLYEVSVWAKIGGSNENAMVSLRTVLVE
jgi:uncharacterized protein YkwD